MGIISYPPIEMARANAALEQKNKKSKRVYVKRLIVFILALVFEFPICSLDDAETMPDSPNLQGIQCRTKRRKYKADHYGS